MTSDVMILDLSCRQKCTDSNGVEFEFEIDFNNESQVWEVYCDIEGYTVGQLTDADADLMKLTRRIERDYGTGV